MLNLDTNFNALRILSQLPATQDSVHLATYPNPTDQSVTILYAVMEKDNVSLRVINSLGQVVVEQKLSTGNSHEISTVELREGLYFIEVVEENQRLRTCKIIVKH